MTAFYTDFNINNWLDDHDFNIANPICDGNIHRVNRGGSKNKSAYYAIHTEPITIIIAGDWKTGERWVHRDDSELDQSQKRAVRRKIESARVDAKKMREAEQLVTKENAELKFATVKELTSHPYLDRKKITPCGAFTDGKNILIPCRDKDGAVWGWQTITDSSVKLFMKHQRVSGTYYTIEGKGERLFITEGYATACSIHMATGCSVIVTYSASNLPVVAKIIAPIHHRSTIIIASDNDHHLKENIGVKYATEAAEAIRCDVIIPEGIEGTDFNDLHCEKGIDALIKELNGSKKVSSINRASHKDKKTVPKAIILKEIVDAMMHKSTSLPPFDEKFLCIPAATGIKCYEVDNNNVAILSHPKLMQRAVLRYTNIKLNNMSDYALLPEDAAKVVNIFESLAMNRDVKIHPVAWPHEPDKITLCRMDFDLDPFVSGPPEYFCEFLSRCSNPDGLCAFIGSIFIADSFKQQYLYINGDGGDGKGELYGFLLMLLKHAAHTEQSPVKIDKFGTSSFAGVRLVGFADFSNPGWIASGQFKQLCSDDPIRMEQKYGLAWSERIDAKMIFLSNKDLCITGENSMIRRAVYTHVDKFEGEVLPHIRHHLWNERVAIISYCLKKYAELTKNNGPILRQAEHLADAIDLGEMSHQILFDKYFGRADGGAAGASLSRKMVRTALEWDGKKSQGDVSAFYGYLRRTGFEETVLRGERKFKDLELLNKPWIRPKEIGD